MTVDKICGDSANLNKKSRVAGLFIYSIMTEGFSRSQVGIEPAQIASYVAGSLAVSPKPFPCKLHTQRQLQVPAVGPTNPQHPLAQPCESVCR
jgi:hypothetical protein